MTHTRYGEPGDPFPVALAGLYGHRAESLSIEYASDGNTVVSAGSDGTVRIGTRPATGNRAMSVMCATRAWSRIKPRRDRGVVGTDRGEVRVVD